MTLFPGYGDSHEVHMSNAMALAMPPLRAPPPPAFDVQVRVRKAPPPPPDRMSDSTSVRSDRNLSTIEEQREEFAPPPPPPMQVRRVAQQPPIYSRIVRKNAQASFFYSYYCIYQTASIYFSHASPGPLPYRGNALTAVLIQPFQIHLSPTGVLDFYHSLSHHIFSLQ